MAAPQRMTSAWGGGGRSSEGAGAAESAAWFKGSLPLPVWASDPEWLARYGRALPLVVYLAKRADWQTGRVCGYRHQDAATYFSCSASAVEQQFRLLRESNVLTVRKRSRYDQDVELATSAHLRLVPHTPAMDSESRISVGLDGEDSQESASLAHQDPSDTQESATLSPSEPQNSETLVRLVSQNFAAPYITSEKITPDPKSESISSSDDERAQAPAAGDVSSALCSRIAKAAKLAAPATSLHNLVRKYRQLGEDELVFQAELAAAWFADPSKNKGGKRQMNILFLHNWFSKAQTPLPPRAAAPPSPQYAPSSPPAAARTPPAFRDVRGLSRSAAPAPLPDLPPTVRASPSP